MKQPRGKENRRLITILYGLDEYNFSELPPKVGGRLSRTIAAFYMRERVCPLCFLYRTRPYLDEKHYPRRSWKRYRNTQWKQLK